MPGFFYSLHHKSPLRGRRILSTSWIIHVLIFKTFTFIFIMLVDKMICIVQMNSLFAKYTWTLNRLSRLNKTSQGVPRLAGIERPLRYVFVGVAELSLRKPDKSVLMRSFSWRSVLLRKDSYVKCSLHH